VKVSYFNLDDRIITSTVVWDEAIQEDDVCDDGYLHTSITENGIVVWRDCYATDYGILAQRVDTSGVVLWDSSNSPVSFCLFICGPSGDKPFVAATPDDGAIVIWEDNRNGTADIYATKIDADGSLPPGISEQPISVTQPSFRVVTNVGRQILLSSSSNQVLTLDIFDASGRLVDEVRCSASSGVVEWGSDHGPGVYFIKPPSNESSAQKVILIR
jgi:hypothetical protein